MGEALVVRRGGGESTATPTTYSTYIDDLGFGSSPSDRTSNFWTMPSNIGLKHLAVYQRPYNGPVTDSNLLYTLDLTKNTTITLHSYSDQDAYNGYFAWLTLEISGGTARLRYRTKHEVYASGSGMGMSGTFGYGVTLFGY